jgi:hypothetical protein
LIAQRPVSACIVSIAIADRDVLRVAVVVVNSNAPTRLSEIIRDNFPEVF